MLFLLNCDNDNMLDVGVRVVVDACWSVPEEEFFGLMLTVVNLSNDCVVKDVVSPDFLAIFDSNEQLLNEAEFLTWVVLLILIGTVQVALNDADLWTICGLDTRDEDDE